MASPLPHDVQPDAPLLCPFDNETPLTYTMQNLTPIWSCTNCPYIAFEYINTENINDLKEYLHEE